MNIYVESNFILELAFEQEQHESCKSILSLCERGIANLILPMFSIAETYETLIRREKRRKDLTQKISGELKQLSRSETYKSQVDALQDVTSLLIHSSKEEKEQLNLVLTRVLSIAQVIPLNQNVLSLATSFQEMLEPQDSIVYASILGHLRTTSAEQKCFLNRNSRDFDNPDIVETLELYSCKMLFNFERGHSYIEGQLS